MTELKRRLFEDIYYPPHDPRKASNEYKRVHHRLVYDMDSPCWICGIKHSEGGKMETHHNHIEWAAANGVDLTLVLKDFPSLSDEDKLKEWLDSEGNMLVLCEKHHRSGLHGIHTVTYPVWVLQRYQNPDKWTFIQQ